ncbi:MAG: hypothetical protein ACE5DX_04200 [Candidatus Dojkabacteria bacterium]
MREFRDKRPPTEDDCWMVIDGEKAYDGIKEGEGYPGKADRQLEDYYIGNLK